MRDRERILVTGAGGFIGHNSRLKKVLGWEPSISLETGLEVTYKWIEAELMKAGRLKLAAAGQFECSQS